MPIPPDSRVTEDEKTAGSAPDPGLTDADDPNAAPEGGGLPLEPPTQAIQRLEGELDSLQDRYVRLAAEYDNFRKRTLRERDDLTDRVQGAFAGRLLDELDDLERLLAGDPTAMSAESLYQGMELLARKLWKELEGSGLERIDPAGQPFDPALHEAVATTPPAEPALDHTVSRTFQAGYRFKGALLRPARVQVYSDPGQI
jgi:molecular chaperone GrpE